MSEEQTVVDQPDATAKPVVEGGDAQEDLDTLLSEYKPTGESPEPPKKDDKEPLNNEQIAQEVQYMREQRERDVAERASRELDETVKSIKGDLNIPDKFVKAFLNQEAFERPELQKAYLERGNNPEKWKKIEASLSKQMRDVFYSLPSKDATNIANQVEAAVRNAQPQTPSQAPDTKTINTMSDGEFDKFVKNAAKQYG